ARLRRGSRADSRSLTGRSGATAAAARKRRAVDAYVFETPCLAHRIRGGQQPGFTLPGQPDRERLVLIANVAVAGEPAAVARSHEYHVRNELKLVGFVQGASLPRGLELHRHELPPAEQPHTLPEDVVGLTSQAQTLVLDQFDAILPRVRGHDLCVGPQTRTGL